jgi:SPP1 family predicted phage head-tail adaptor
MLCYDQTLMLQREVREPDARGGGAVTWDDVFRTRANIMPLQGREMLTAQQLEQITTHRVRFRHHPSLDVDVSMRIVWETNGGKILNIVSCPDPGPRAQLREIIAQEGGAV